MGPGPGPGLETRPQHGAKGPTRGTGPDVGMVQAAVFTGAGSDGPGGLTCCPGPWAGSETPGGTAKGGSGRLVPSGPQQNGLLL